MLHVKIPQKLDYVHTKLLSWSAMHSISMHQDQLMQLRHRSIIRVRSQNLGQDSIRLGFRNPKLLLDNPVVVPCKVRNRKGQILQRHGGIPPIAISFDWKSLQIMHVRLPHAQYWPHVRCCTFSLFFDGLCFHDFHGVFTVIGWFFTVKSRIFTVTNFIKFWPS